MKRTDDHAPSLRARDQDETLSPAAVSAWLRAHPDFFLTHEDVLADLELPHRAGAAVSLVERQVALLRERNIESRKNLGRLVETARENDALFTQVRLLVVRLIECTSLDALAHTLDDLLRQQFGAACSRLVLTPSARAAAGQQGLAPQDWPELFDTLLARGQVLTGPLRPRERAALFGADADTVESAAIVPVAGRRQLALLAIGSRDPQHFHGEMGTMFLDFIGAVLQALLPRLLDAGAP